VQLESVALVARKRSSPNPEIRSELREGLGDVPATEAVASPPIPEHWLNFHATILSALIGAISAVAVAILSPIVGHFLSRGEVEDLRNKVSYLEQNNTILGQAARVRHIQRGYQEKARISDQMEILEAAVAFPLPEQTKPQVDMLDTVGLIALHQGRTPLRRALKQGGKIRLLLLDPTSAEFWRRAEVEKDTMGRLAFELLKSLHLCADLQGKVDAKEAARLELCFYQVKPDRELFMVNSHTPQQGLVMHNEYHRMSESVPILPTEVLETFPGPSQVYFSGDPLNYHKHVEHFEKLWRSGRPRTIQQAIDETWRELTKRLSKSGAG
jgi:hypothetical protein